MVVYALLASGCKAKIPIKGIERVDTGASGCAISEEMQSKNPNKGN